MQKLRNNLTWNSFICIKFKSLLIIKMYRFQTWKCQTCNEQISQEIYPCPNCIDNIYNHSQEIKKEVNRCQICTYVNPEHTSQCIICGTLLRIQLREKQISKQTCPKCKNQNDLSNLSCAFCDQQLYQSVKRKCAICGNQIKQDLFDAHYTSCMLTHQMLEEQEKLAKQQAKRMQEQLKRMQLQRIKNQYQQCIHCRAKLSPAQIRQHLQQCRKKSIKDLVFDPTTRMTDLQLEAIRYMTEKSQKQHNAVKKDLQDRIKKLGCTIQDLNNLQFYVENYAPIIIHIHISKHLGFFLNDTHYRSQFQTNKSSGSLSRPSRTGWEDRMFDKKYARASDFERVKYGVINFTNDPKGVGACVGYGQSYFQLKQHVRPRCTFTDMDSSNANSSIATFKFCFKILSKMNDKELIAAIDASKAKQVSSACTTTYKQMQIHGPIEFAKDIQCIYVNRKQLATDKKLLDMVYQFSKKYKVNYDFF